MLKLLIRDQRQARKFAGKVTAEMIRLGADAEVMRKHGIPKHTFYGVFGGRLWRGGDPTKVARRLLRSYKPSVLFAPQEEHGPLARNWKSE